MAQACLPLAQRPAGALAAVAGVMTDIDDTLTREGAIEPAALDALHALRKAGIALIAITGRPLGWSLPFAEQWPLDAIVAENGAVALIPGPSGLAIEYAQDETTRGVNRTRLDAAAARILGELPHARLATDSAGRVTDVAIDHSEFATLAPTDIERVLGLMQADGLNATVSSIHVNGWFGSHDKWSGACWMVQRLFGRQLESEAERWIYVGDSANDQVMFRRFVYSAGVANLRRFAAELRDWPVWITAAERGKGFAEVAAALLADRAARAVGAKGAGGAA